MVRRLVAAERMGRARGPDACRARDAARLEAERGAGPPARARARSERRWRAGYGPSSPTSRGCRQARCDRPAPNRSSAEVSACSRAGPVGLRMTARESPGGNCAGMRRDGNTKRRRRLRHAHVRPRQRALSERAGARPRQRVDNELGASGDDFPGPESPNLREQRASLDVGMPLREDH